MHCLSLETRMCSGTRIDIPVILYFTFFPCLSFPTLEKPPPLVMFVLSLIAWTGFVALLTNAAEHQQKPRNTRHSTHLAERATLATGWSIQSACLSDANSPNRLLTYSYIDAKLTLESCTTACSNREFKYAAVQWGRECWCGNSLNTAGGAGKTLPASLCSTPCTGDSTSTCGGYYALTVYTGPSTPWNLAAACLTDETAPHRLLSISTIDSKLTPASCDASCASQGYSFAGVQYGRECWCGNALNTAGGAGAIRPRVRMQHTMYW